MDDCIKSVIYEFSFGFVKWIVSHKSSVHFVLVLVLEPKPHLQLLKRPAVLTSLQRIDGFGTGHKWCMIGI